MDDEIDIDDLVRRLRASNGRGQGGKIKIEAADVIDRLRTELAVFRSTRRLFHRLHVINERRAK